MWTTAGGKKNDRFGACGQVFVFKPELFPHSSVVVLTSALLSSRFFCPCIGIWVLFLKLYTSLCCNVSSGSVFKFMLLSTVLCSCYGLVKMGKRSSVGLKFHIWMLQTCLVIVLGCFYEISIVWRLQMLKHIRNVTFTNVEMSWSLAWQPSRL